LESPDAAKRVRRFNGKGDSFWTREYQAHKIARTSTKGKGGEKGRCACKQIFHRRTPGKTKRDKGWKKKEVM